MLSFEIPDFGDLHLDQLVLDFNGTLARDGRLLPGVAERLARLAAALTVHVVTGDTNGTAQLGAGRVHAWRQSDGDVAAQRQGGALDLHVQGVARHAGHVGEQGDAVGIFDDVNAR